MAVERPLNRRQSEQQQKALLCLLQALHALFIILDYDAQKVAGSEWVKGRAKAETWMNITQKRSEVGELG